MIAHRLNLGNAEVCISSTTNHHNNNIKQLSFKYLVNTVSSFNLILIITLGEHCFPHIIDKKLILSKMKINDMIKLIIKINQKLCVELFFYTEMYQ